MNNERMINWLRIAFSYGVGSASMLKLIKHFGSIENIFNAKVVDLSQIVSKGLAENILSDKSQVEVDKALAWQAKNLQNRYILTLESELYPVELAMIASPPLVLFAEGNPELLKNQKIAIVGTRHPTAQGIENSRMFAKELAANNLTIVSGLASGIDRYAHEGALTEKAATIGVLGTGIDLIYPASNREIFKLMSQKGLILSEYPLGTNALSNNFPRRNRIIVGLSQACLVIESGVDGGSMISANFALEMGREVMAIPGSIHNPMARGCHKLLKQGAKLVENAQDILDDLRLTLTDGNRSEPKENYAETNDPVLEAMGFDPISIDGLCAKLNYDFGDLCGRLLELELAGSVNNCGGGRYQRIFHAG